MVFWLITVPVIIGGVTGINHTLLVMMTTLLTLIDYCTINTNKIKYY